MVKISMNYHIITKGKNKGNIRKTPKTPKTIFLEVLEDYKKEGFTFTDVKVYTDKVMATETSDDPSRGWTGYMPYIIDKPKKSRIALLVTYDGDGYNLLSINADYGPIATNEYEKRLKKEFGDRYSIEHYANWAFQVYEE